MDFLDLYYLGMIGRRVVTAVGICEVCDGLEELENGIESGSSRQVRDG